MPKKARGSKKRQPRAAKPQQATQGPQQTDSAPQATQNARPAMQDAPAQSNGSQRYVITELKQIGILAGGILVTLVVLSFVLG